MSGVGNLGFAEVILLLALLLTVFPFWRIFGKAGFSPLLSLSMLVPVVNIIMLYYLAFAEWPRQRGEQGAP